MQVRKLLDFIKNIFPSVLKKWMKRLTYGFGMTWGWVVLLTEFLGETIPLILLLYTNSEGWRDESNREWEVGVDKMELVIWTDCGIVRADARPNSTEGFSVRCDNLHWVSLLKLSARTWSLEVKQRGPTPWSLCFQEKNEEEKKGFPDCWLFSVEILAKLVS